MKKLVGIFTLSIFTITAGMGMAHAEQVCKVTDPTGTPLNIRDKPLTIVKTVRGCIQKDIIKENTDNGAGRLENLSLVIIVSMKINSCYQYSYS